MNSLERVWQRILISLYWFYIKEIYGTPRGANKVSSLSKWPQLMKFNAPKVHCIKDEKSDLCMVKAFAVVLHQTFSEFEAKQASEKFNERKYFFYTHDPNLKVIHKYTQNCFQDSCNAIINIWNNCNGKLHQMGMIFLE